MTANISVILYAVVRNRMLIYGIEKQAIQGELDSGVSK